jgi:hypothetical protein
MCLGADLAEDAGKPAADPSGGERAVRDWRFLPGAAQVGDVRPGEQQLGAGGRDEPDPPADLLWGADLGGGQAEGCSGRILGCWLDLGLRRRNDQHPCLSRWLTGCW